MKAFGSILSKILVIIATLVITMSLAILPLFSLGEPLKNNIAVMLTLIANKVPITSDFYKQLMNSNNSITSYIIGILLIFNLNYLIPLLLVKKPFIKALIAIYMLLMTLLFAFFILVIFNIFNFVNFQTITITGWWISPFVAIILSLLAIFWYGLRNLWVNPPKIQPVAKPEIINEEILNVNVEETTYEDLQSQLKMLKRQLKEVKNVKPKRK